MMLNVHPAMHLTHTPEFRIHLEDNHIILHGTAEESLGAFLRGRITLNCQEQTKVKSIFLRFTGITNVHWTEGERHYILKYFEKLTILFVLGVGSHVKHYKATRTIIEKETTFLELKKKPYSLSHGKYKW
jgi:hypothetical protein